MKKILLCAFDPFGGEVINPALEAIKLVDTVGIELEKCEVPTVFYRSIEVVTDRIEKFKPDAILMIGQAGGRDKITPERIAINISDANIDDNEGNRPSDEPVAVGAPAAYFSTLPIKGIATALNAEGIPSAISNSAGTFVCNHLMFGVLNYIAERSLDAIAGFIHIPFLPEQVVGREGVPSLPLSVDVRAIEIAIGVIVGVLEEEKRHV